MNESLSIYILEEYIAFGADDLTFKPLDYIGTGFEKHQ